MTALTFANLVPYKQQKFIPSRFWAPEVQNQYHWVEINMATGHAFSKDFRVLELTPGFQCLQVAGVP